MNNIPTNYEQALTLTGYGRFHHFLAVCCALSLLAAGLQNGLNAYVLPAAQCDLYLSLSQIGYLNASFLIGGISSAFVWGLLGDLIGRKKVLATTLLSDWITTIFAGLSHTYFILLVFRFINGFLIGAAGTLTYSYFSEFQPQRIRTQNVCYLGMFFTLAWIVLPALAWLIMPLQLNLQLGGIVINSWRLYMFIVSIPSFLAGIGLWKLPESPKFLLSRRESKQALLILKQIYVTNTKNSPESFPVKILAETTAVKQTLGKANSVKTVGRGRTVRLIKDARDQMKLLYQRPLLSKTILSTTLLFTNMFGYLGLGLWIPEILNRFKEYNNVFPEEKITFCELQTYFENLENNSDVVWTTPPDNFTSYLVDDYNKIRCVNKIDATVFTNTFIMGACSLIGNVATSILASTLNRKILPVSTTLLGGITAAGLYWLNSSVQHLIIGSIFLTCMSAANITIYGVVVDIFPTSVSAMAVCLATLAGRLGAVVSNLVLGSLLEKSCEIPIIVVVATLIVGATVGLYIPSQKPGEKREETINETYRSVSDISVISKL